MSVKKCSLKCPGKCFKNKQGLPQWLSGQESSCQYRRHKFDPWSGKMSHAREQLTPVATSTEPRALEPQRSHRNEKPVRHNSRKALAATKTQHSQINKYFFKKLSKGDQPGPSPSTHASQDRGCVVGRRSGRDGKGRKGEGSGSGQSSRRSPERDEDPRGESLGLFPGTRTGTQQGICCFLGNI